MDFDDAYAIGAHIPGSEAYPEIWAHSAANFRAVTRSDIDVSYGETARQKMDFFYPPQAAKGLVVFVHGGYWRSFDKSFWSHLAAGPVSCGWTVAMPSYDLCPDVRITEIGRQIARSIAFAAGRVAGPIRLVGHSAGGHLVARVMDLPDAGGWQKRVQKVVAISPVADLVPLLQTSMNDDLMLTKTEALRESPLRQPAPDLPVTVWVGADERPVFIAQAKAFAQAWDCRIVVEHARHHFDVIEGMADEGSSLLAEVIS